MSPRKTITFQELRERNEASLNRVDFTPDVETASLKGTQRSRIGVLLSQRAELEDLASTQVQREEYGVEQWHEQFVRLRDILDENLRTRVWEAIPNSRFKRFQQVFSHPHQFIVPSFKTEGDAVLFQSCPNFNTMSLQPCLVSPDCIPEKLANDLQLTEFDDEDRGRPLRRLKKKAEPEAIQRLKAIWESAQPLQEGHHRVLVVNKAPQEVCERYGEAANIAYENIGSILYTREAENGRNTPRQLTVQYFSSVYDAHRKTLHEAKCYSKEIDALVALREDIVTLSTQLNRDWKTDTPQQEKDRMREEAHQLLSESVQMLQLCENKYKIQAHDLLETTQELRDSRNRVNISASLSKMVAAVDRLKNRFHEMYPKGGFNEQDRMALQCAISAQERSLKTFRTDLQSNAHVLENGLELFSDTELSSNQTESQATGLLGRLRVHPQNIERAVTLRPFITYRDRLTEKYDNLSDAAHSRDRNGTQDAVVSMHVIGKLQGIRSCFERVRLHMVDSEGVSLKSVSKFVFDMSEYVSQFQVLPDHTVDGYEEVFTEMRNQLKGLEDLLRRYAQESDAGPHSQIYTELKQYLSDFDIEHLTQQLP